MALMKDENWRVRLALLGSIPRLAAHGMNLFQSPIGD
jgi:hypothetical protein